MLRFAIAGLVGATVFVVRIVAAASRTAIPVSEESSPDRFPWHGRKSECDLFDFRGLDTLGEITVLGVASIGAVALARVGHRSPGSEPLGLSPACRRQCSGSCSLIFPCALIFHVVLMASLWLLFAVHNHRARVRRWPPRRSAFPLRFIAGGMTEVRRHARFRPWTVLGAGTSALGRDAFFPIFGGGAVLDVAYKTITLPLIGEMSMSSAVVFDIASI